MNDFVNNLILIAGFEILGFFLKYIFIAIILSIILFVVLPAYIQHVLFSDSLKAIKQVEKALEQIVDKLDKSAYKQDVTLVHLANIRSILANIDRRTHYRKIRGVPRD